MLFCTHAGTALKVVKTNGNGHQLISNRKARIL